MRKIIIFTLAFMTILTGAIPAYGTEYTDLESQHWAYGAVKAMSDQSIISGYPNGSFLPNKTVTYGEFIKMALIAATGEDAGNAASGNWAVNYYNKALELKYFTVFDIDKADLNKQIVRSHMALIISSILGDVKIEDYDGIQRGITDINYQTKYEYDITKAYASGILTGYTDNTFRPDKTLSRAEAATVIYRLVDESKRQLPGGEEKEEPTIEKKITISFANWDKTFEKTLKTAKLGDYGITKLSITSNGYVAIYSTMKYDSIRLIIDNVVTSFFVNPNGTSYWVENGYYVYYAEPRKDGISVTGKMPTLWFLDDYTIHQFTDVTL